MLNACVQSSYRIIDSVEFIKQDNINTAAYEIGYVNFVSMEKYRKMVDKYNTTSINKYRNYVIENLMFLEDIEAYYFEIDHLSVSSHNATKKSFNGSIFHELSWPVKMMVIKDKLRSQSSQNNRLSPEPMPKRRIPEIQYLVSGRRDDAEPRDPNEDDNSMRLKLFRLMYETIRDSDLKCKRADLIRTHYKNSSVFEVGYLMGDVMDKFNIMSDISMTLNRLFHEWKPIEHINAYEQISNQAIEINHLIDTMRTISRRNETKKDEKY
ncbi:uncharacterized protein LOC111361297 [Spodoptera litura]|uniref:Uncharacterized protein LOC111361297 n=1 Tax=Spodoptera litura TaxID=69820 RepID=A0A9J7J232_SPOLT|nr:uncharacterized protein LOC111361297 [Spodoptera litura]